MHLMILPYVFYFLNFLCNQNIHFWQNTVPEYTEIGNHSILFSALSCKSTIPFAFAPVKMQNLALI